MKILILCNKPPYPPNDGGAIGIFNLSKDLASLGHDVHLLAMNTKKHNASNVNIPSIPNYQIDYVNVNTDIHPVKLLINLFFSRLPYIAERFISKKYLNKLTSLLYQNHFDIIQIEGPYLWFCLDAIRKLTDSKVSMKSHNIEHEIWQRTATIEKNLIKKLYLYHLAYRIKKFEISVFNRFDFIFAVTPRDKNIFIKLGVVKPVLLVPTGINPTKTHFANQIDLNTIFFIGGLDWIPNQEGLLWFTDKVWPKLISKHPQLMFHVAGRNAPKWLPKRLNKTNIKFHGEVKESHAFMGQYGIMISPVFSGSGMRVKIVEGMSLGKPIVTTTLGAEGLDVNDGKDIVIADTIETFCSKIIELIENKKLTERLALNAHKNAVEKYNNIDIAKNVAEFYAKNAVNENRGIVDKAAIEKN